MNVCDVSCARTFLLRYVFVCVFLARNVFPSVCVCLSKITFHFWWAWGRKQRGVCPSLPSHSCLCSAAPTVVYKGMGQQEHCIQTIVKNSSTVVPQGKKRMILCVQVCMCVRPLDKSTALDSKLEGETTERPPRAMYHPLQAGSPPPKTFSQGLLGNYQNHHKKYAPLL